MTIITAGSAYSDIDVLACSLAYRDLLRLQGIAAEAVLPGPLNNSITDSMRAWDLDFLTAAPEADADYVLVDVSNPDYFASFVQHDRIVEVYDHHFGFEKLWQDRLGADAHIEAVGSCTTLIWEAYVRAGKQDDISERSANLLAAGIASNTLNFKAAVTHQRDRDAFDALMTHVSIDDAWIARYFEDQSAQLFADIGTAIRSDSKNVVIEGRQVIMAQIELWDGKAFVTGHHDEIVSTLDSMSEAWILTCPSIGEGFNYLVSNDEALRTLISDKLGVRFDGDTGVTDRLYMRKEILRELGI